MIVLPRSDPGAHMVPMPIGQVSPSSLPEAGWPWSQVGDRRLTLALSTLTILTNFCGPPEGCHRTNGEIGEAQGSAISTGLGAWHPLPILAACPISKSRTASEQSGCAMEQPGFPSPTPGGGRQGRGLRQQGSAGRGARGREKSRPPPDLAWPCSRQECPSTLLRDRWVLKVKGALCPKRTRCPTSEETRTGR